MKKLIFIFTLLVNFNNCFSQAGWQKILSGYENSYFNSVCFPSQDTGFVIGGGNSKYNYPNIILRTTNCGVSWIEFQGNLPITAGTGLNSIFFITAKTGFITSSHNDSTGNHPSLGSIIKTTNAGENWFNIYNEYSGRSTLREITFVNENTGFVTCNWPYKYLKTTNGGNTWDSVPTPYSQDYVFHFFFINSTTGFMTGMINTMFKTTTNGGLSWDDRTSYLNGYMETGNMFFLNQNTGYVYGIGNGTGRYLIKTTNSGYNWMTVNNLQYDTLNLVFFRPHFTNANTGYYIGTYFDNVNNLINSYILQTTDGGLTFHSQHRRNSWINALTFVNANTGFAVGDSGLVLKTTNGGVSHSVSGQVRYSDNSISATGGYVKAIKIDRLTGSVITYDSVQIQANGNYSLTNVPQDSVDIGVYPNSSTQNDWVMTYYPSTIYWQNATTIYPTGNLTNINVGVYRLSSATNNNSVNGKVMRLNDSPSLANLKDAVLYAKSGNTFVRCGISDANGVYHLLSLPAGSLKIICNRIGFTGDSTTVNVTSTSNIDSINFYLYKLSVGIKQIGSAVPSAYKLYQNYPNPFNPNTSIKYQVASIKYVKLVVYDILGKEIAVLVNEKQLPGVYEVTFDGSSLPTGVYFYKLEAGEYTETKKMLLIK